MSRLEPPSSGSISRHDLDTPEFVQRGKVLVVQRQFQEAVKVCRLGLLGHPACVEGRLVLGMALMALGRHEEVVAEMRVALELDADNPMGHLLRGEALLGKAELQLAYDALLRAHDLDPLNEKVRRLLIEVEDRIDPDADEPDRPHTSTKVYPAPAARKLPAPRETLSGVSGVSSVSQVSVRAEIDDDAIISSVEDRSVGPSELETAGAVDVPSPSFDDDDDDDTGVSDDWGDPRQKPVEAAPHRDAEGYDPMGHDPEGYDPEGYDPEGYDPEGYDAEGYGYEDGDDGLPYEDEDESFTTAPWLPPQRFGKRRTPAPGAGDTEVEEARVRATDRRDLEARATHESVNVPIGGKETEEASVEVSGLPFTTTSASGIELDIDDPEEGESTEVNYDAPPPSTLFGDEEAELDTPVESVEREDLVTADQLDDLDDVHEEVLEDDLDDPDLLLGVPSGSLRRGATTELGESEAGAFGFGDDDDPTATQDVESWDIGQPRRPGEPTAAVVLPEAGVPVGETPETERAEVAAPLQKASTGTEILPEDELDDDGRRVPRTPAPHTPALHTPAPHTPALHTPAPHTPAPHTPQVAERFEDDDPFVGEPSGELEELPGGRLPPLPRERQIDPHPGTLVLDDDEQLEESELEEEREDEESRPGTLVLDSAHRREAARVSALVDGPLSSADDDELPRIGPLARQTVDGFAGAELSVPSSSAVEVLSEISVEVEGSRARHESDVVVSDPGTAELSLDSLELLPDPPPRPRMPPLPEESHEVALPPSGRPAGPPGGKLPPNLPALPPDAAADVLDAPFEADEHEDSEDSDLETRVNFAGLPGRGEAGPKPGERPPDIIDAPSPFEEPPPARGFGPPAAAADAPSHLGDLPAKPDEVPYDDAEMHDYVRSAPDGHVAPPYDDGEVFPPPAYDGVAPDAPGYEPPGYEPPGYEPPGYEPPGYEPPGYEPPGYEPPGYGAPDYPPGPGYEAPPYDAVPYRPPSHLDDDPGAPPARAEPPILDEPLVRPPSHLDDDPFDGLDAPSHLDQPRPQIEDRLGPYPGDGARPPYEGAVDFRPAVPVEPDSQEISLEQQGPGPQRTAALDHDDGRIRPYVDSKQGTVETSPGGPRGLRSPAPPARIAEPFNDRRGVGGARRGEPELHQQLTGEARIARDVSRRAARERTSWVTLMLGDPGRQRWMRGAIALGIVVLALAGGFLFRYLRIGHAVDRKRNDAASLLRKGNLDDFVEAARKFDDIIRSRRDKTRAWLSRVCINAAIPFEFGDNDPRPIGNADSVTGVDAPEKAALAIYRKLAKGDLARAATLADELRKRYPKDARLHYLGGRVLLLQGSYEAAATRLERAIMLDAGHALYHRSLGDALAARGRVDKAEEQYARALKINPEHIATWISRAKLLLELRKLDQAERLLRAIVANKHAARGQRGWAYALQARLAAARGEVALVRKLVDMARSHAPEQDPTFYDTLADISIAAFALGDAERYAKRSEQLMRGRPHPRLAKARIYLRQGRAQAALEALPARPQAEVSSVLRARIMLRLRRVADARRYAKSALSSAADSVEANLVMAKVLAAEGKYIEAQDKLSALLAKREDDARVLTAMGEVLLARKRLGDAKRRFEQAIRADKTALEAKLRLADVLLFQGDFARAHKTLIEVHKRHSWYVPILRRLAELDLGKRNLIDARSNYDLVLKLVPRDARAQLGIVKVLTLERKFAEARRLLGKVRGAMPGALELAEGRLALAQGEGRSAAGKLKDAKVPLRKKLEPWLLLVRAKIFNNQLGEADALIRQMERQFGKRHPAPWEARGHVAYGRGKLRPAVTAFEKALERADGALLMPIDRARLHAQLGRAQQDLGKVADALRHYQKAKALCPRCPEPLFNEGLALDEQGKKDAAIAALRKAKRLAPKMLQVYVELAKIYASAGKTSQAIKMYQKYISLDPPGELKQQARSEIETLRMK